MSSLFYVINRQNICKSCRYSKDHFRESCYCVQYGFIVTYGKEKCKGYKPLTKKEGDENEVSNSGSIA